MFQHSLYYTSPWGKKIPIQTARTFKIRFMGLMGQNENFYGLLLEPCNSIHTFFMKYPLDAIYLDKDNRVLSIRHNIKPFKITSPVFGATKVLEFPSSLNATAFLKKGTYVKLDEK